MYSKFEFRKDIHFETQPISRSLDQTLYRLSYTEAVAVNLIFCYSSFIANSEKCFWVCDKAWVAKQFTFNLASCKSSLYLRETYDQSRLYLERRKDFYNTKYSKFWKNCGNSIPGVFSAIWKPHGCIVAVYCGWFYWHGKELQFGICSRHVYTVCYL